MESMKEDDERELVDTETAWFAHEEQEDETICGDRDLQPEDLEGLENREGLDKTRKGERT